MNDKEGRKWLLQKLYDKGFKYIFHSSSFGAYLATKQQPITKDNRTYIEGSFERIDILSDLIPDFNEPNYLDIGEYLGIIDWNKVAVDTPIFVEKRLGVVVKRHFAKFENGRVCFFGGGLTSWSCALDGITYIDPKYVRLAGGDDEN